MTPFTIALYQPEIPQNTGTLIRMGACLGIGVDIIHPCGFVMSDKNLQRASMDYRDFADVKQHPSWDEFLHYYCMRRIILLTPDAPLDYVDFEYDKGDVLLFGQESCGFPSSVKAQIPLSLKISMLPNRRSLNLALSAAMVAGEALRQIRQKGYGNGL